MSAVREVEGVPVTSFSARIDEEKNKDQPGLYREDFDTGGGSALSKQITLPEN